VAAIASPTSPTSATSPTAAGPVAKSTVTPAPIAPDDRGVDPSTLPAAQGDRSARGTAPSAPVAVAANAAHPTPATPVAPAPPATQATVPAAAAPPAAAPATTASAAAGGDLQALMQQAAGVTASPTATATATTGAATPQVAPGSVPLKPSVGAVQGALGAALPGARACLGPDDPISRAMVTFQSDGSVESVTVSGWAVGKPAEGCIRAALMKARVEPFAQPSFSAPTTIRPN
jgi:Meckel syndrome type 1 protein